MIIQVRNKNISILRVIEIYLDVTTIPYFLQLGWVWGMGSGFSSIFFFPLYLFQEVEYNSPSLKYFNY